MKDNKVTVVAFLFGLLCLAMIGGVYYLDTRLKELQAQYDDLRQREANLENTTKNLMEQKTVFTNAFKELENYSINVSPSELAFYSEVQQAIQVNGLEILSTRQQGVNKEGISTISMTLRGDYYALMQVLAAWRNLPMTVKVANLTVRSESSSRNNTVPPGWVQADATLEAVAAQP